MAASVFEQLQGREFNAGGAVGPRPGEAVHEITAGILFEPLKRHSPSACVPNQALQLIPPMRRTFSPARSPKAIHCLTEAAMVRANSGS